MASIAGIAVLVVLIGGYIMYGSWLTKGIQPRQFDTHLAPDVLRGMFSDKVARSGWKIVDDGNPMVAQSSLATGMRQQISLKVERSDGGSSVHVGPQRWITKRGVPKKGHTIRMRLDSFVAAVQAQDPSIQPRLAALKSR